jgi:protein TonB
MARQTPSPDPETLSSREKRLNSPSMTTLEKFYEESWVRKVEQVGNLNFPEEARRRNLTKGPVLAVAIRADGTIKNIRILSSSGHPPIDQAATQIVRLASPYSPFPPELRRQYDVLTIVRRWEFKHGRLSGR